MLVAWLAAPAWGQWAIDPVGDDPPSADDDWNASAVSTVDADADGQLDVVGVWAEGPTVFRGLGGLSFDPDPEDSWEEDPLDHPDVRIRGADLNLDGLDDLVFRGKISAHVPPGRNTQHGPFTRSRVRGDSTKPNGKQ